MCIRNTYVYAHFATPFAWHRVTCLASAYISKKRYASSGSSGLISLIHWPPAGYSVLVAEGVQLVAFRKGDEWKVACRDQNRCQLVLAPTRLHFTRQCIFESLIHRFYAKMEMNRSCCLVAALLLSTRLTVFLWKKVAFTFSSTHIFVICLTKWNRTNVNVKLKVIWFDKSVRIYKLNENKWWPCGEIRKPLKHSFIHAYQLEPYSRVRGCAFVRK